MIQVRSCNYCLPEWKQWTNWRMLKAVHCTLKHQQAFDLGHFDGFLGFILVEINLNSGVM